MQRSNLDKINDNGSLESEVSPARDYSKIAAKVRAFLVKKGFSEIGAIEDESKGRFTYSAEIEEMPFFIKLSAVESGDDDAGKRQKAIKNEIIALTELWKTFPAGETKSFVLPPGPETIFDEDYEGLRIGGYSRFWIEGKVLGNELRSGAQHIGSWVDRFVEIAKEVDAFPDLSLPRTAEKEMEEYEKLIIRNTKYWGDKLTSTIRTLSESGGAGVRNPDKMIELAESIPSVVRATVEYFENSKVTRGSSLKEMIPDNVVFENGPNPHLNKPYFVNFGHLCQSYPRYYDIARLYAWICAVLGEVEVALMFWGKACERFDVNQRQYLEHLSNYLLLGSIYDFMIAEKDLKVGRDVFLGDVS